jgi:hypothetical protein
MQLEMELIPRGQRSSVGKVDRDGNGHFLARRRMNRTPIKIL